ncbi:hypothetical protein Trydic_g11455 [Trypoxylus dichotomus]
MEVLFAIHNGSEDYFMKILYEDVPPIHGARGVAFTKEDKAEAFAETFERQFSPVYENLDVNPIGRIPQLVRYNPRQWKRLLPVTGKIADRIDVIPNCQFEGTHQVLRIAEQIQEGFNRREYTGALFLDVAKAFDKVWHQGLVLKMHRARRG